MNLRLSLVFLLLSSHFAYAEDGNVSFVVGGGLGITSLEFDEKLDADTSFNTYQVFASAGFKRAYASLTYADSISDENVSEEDELGSASRQDIDLTIGYRVTDQWTLFLGYKDGETELDFRVRDSNVVQDEYYREDGLYAGATYTLPLNKAGSLNFSLAYIRFDTDLKFTEGVDEDDDPVGERVEFDDLEGKFSGDSDGFSAGVNWVMPLSNHLAFRAQYKINQYDIEVKSAGLKFKPDQRLSYFDVGLLYAF
jgi:outer membrane protein with beta-barrel domain